MNGHNTFFGTWMLMEATTNHVPLWSSVCTHYKAPDSIWLNSSARKDKAPAKGTAGTLSQIVWVVTRAPALFLSSLTFPFWDPAQIQLFWFLLSLWASNSPWELLWQLIWVFVSPLKLFWQTKSFRRQLILRNHEQQTSSPFHFTCSGQYWHGTVLLGHSASKCFLRSFLLSFLPHSFGQSNSTNSQSLRWS